MPSMKKFAEDSEIRYLCTVWVNGEEAGSVSSYSSDGLQEELSKLDNAISTKLNEQYENLPDPIEDEEAVRIIE